MGDFYEWAKKGSDAHRAEVHSEGLQLTPIDDSQEALERFQEVAQRAFEHEGYGFTVLIEHQSSRHPGGLYDNLVLLRDDE